MTRNSKRNEEELAAFKLEALEALNEVEIGLVSMNLGRRVQDNVETIGRFLHAIHAGAKLNKMEALTRHVNEMFASLLQMNEEKIHRSDGIYYLICGCQEIRRFFDGHPINFKSVKTLSKAGRMIDGEVLETYRNIFNRLKDATMSKGLIMVVDDEPDMGDLLKKQLEDCEFAAECFDSGDKLLNRVATRTPDLIISDYNMPGMNGVELMRATHKINDEIPVIFVSAFLTKDVVLEALRLGAFGFVEKPVDEVQLLLMVETAVARSKATKLINRSLNFLKYHFAELNETLQKHGKSALVNSIRIELEDITKQQRKLNDLSTKSEEPKFERKKAA
jgi:CheY-like chemotaxis protein